MSTKTHAPRVRIVTAAEVDAEHVRERRAMLARGVKCNFKGRDGEAFRWAIDFAGMARESKTGRVQGVAAHLIPAR